MVDVIAKEIYDIRNELYINGNPYDGIKDYYIANLSDRRYLRGKEDGIWFIIEELGEGLKLIITDELNKLYNERVNKAD